MKIYGFQKTTLLDYPEHIAATIFTGGCNFRCPFCHNGDLALDCGQRPAVPEEEVLAYLEKRSGILEGVCITGGEPALQPDLPEFIGKIRELGYLVKLDTNGYYPDMLSRLLEAGLLNYVAMDVKAAPGNYRKAAGCPELDFTRIEKSILLLKGCGNPYEFRTTLVRGLHEPEEFEEVGRLLSGARAYYLQAFRESDRTLEKGFLPFSGEEMEKIRRRVEKYVDKTELRGVE